jgi:hypothetical protein
MNDGCDTLDDTSEYNSTAELYPSMTAFVKNFSVARTH